jgi:hypothetical protein
VRLDKMGSLSSRRGLVRYLGVEAPHELRAIGRWQDPNNPSDSRVLVTDTEGRILHVSTGLNDYAVLYTGLSSGDGKFLTARNLSIFHNGQNRPVMYDGNRVVDMGLSAPQAAPQVLTNGSGNLLLSGLRKYAYSYYDAVTGSESSSSPLTEIDLGTGNRPRVFLQAPAQARVTHIRIYRTLDQGAVPLLAATVPATQIQWNDEVPDDQLSTFTVQLDNGLPQPFECMAHYKGYLFGSVGNTLYWSKPLQFDAWPAVHSTEVPFEGNDTIMALWSHQDALLVFGRKNVLLVAGSGGNWMVNRADVELGAVNGRAITEVEGTVVFLSYQGLYAFPGFNPVAPKLSRLLSGLPHWQLEDANLIYVPQERSLWLAVGDGTYTVHVPNQAISWYSFRARHYLPGGADGFSLPLMLDDKYVNAYGGVTDLGQPIPILWRSKVFQLTNPESTKFMRRIGALASTGTNSVVTISIADRSSSYTVALQSVQGGNEAFWGQDNWDEFDWTSEGLSYFIGSLPAHALFGHTVQVTISAETEDETEVVTPVTLEFREATRFFGV